MPELLTADEVEDLSRDEPPWKPGDTLRLEHPKFTGSMRQQRDTLREAGSLHILRRLYKSCGGCWMVGVIGSPLEFYSGRFSLASTTKPRYKTNHKLGVPKGKLP